MKSMKKVEKVPKSKQGVFLMPPTDSMFSTKEATPLHKVRSLKSRETDARANFYVLEVSESESSHLFRQFKATCWCSSGVYSKRHRGAGPSQKARASGECALVTTIPVNTGATALPDR